MRCIFCKALIGIYPDEEIGWGICPRCSRRYGITENQEKTKEECEKILFKRDQTTYRRRRRILRGGRPVLI